MSFDVRGERIVASGEILKGDAARFAALISTLPRNPMDAPAMAISLSSPGGSLMEGIRLGTAIREAGIPTLVQRSNSCLSACAIAFLGGQITGVTSNGVQRLLEPGAKLGYHGFAVSVETVNVVNETLDTARLINAMILDYASRLGSVDIGMLSTFLNTPSSEMTMVDTPRKIAGLGIRLVGDAPKPPKGWAKTACLSAISELLGPLDPIGSEGRIVGSPKPIATLETFRSQLLDDKYPSNDRNEGVRKVVSKLPATDAINLLAGRALPTNATKVGIWRVDLERGAGFYYDVCYAITDFTSIWTVIVDALAPSAVTKVANTLAGFPANEQLW